jgi:hypothetical protein
MRLHISGSKATKAPENNQRQVHLEKAEPDFDWQCPLCDLGIRDPPLSRGDMSHLAARRQHLREAHPRASADRALKGRHANGKDRRKGKRSAAASARNQTQASNRRAARTVLNLKQGKGRAHSQVRLLQAPKVLKSTVPVWAVCLACGRARRSLPELAKEPCAPVDSKVPEDSPEATVLREFLAALRPPAAETSDSSSRNHGGHSSQA